MLKQSNELVLGQVADLFRMDAIIRAFPQQKERK